MKWIVPVVLLLVLAALAWSVWRSSSMQAKIARHQEGWWQAVRANASSAPAPLFRRLNPFRDNSSFYWHNERQFHERELSRLGYLTNYELRLTNQVMTPALYSNFFWRIRAELGTNTDQIWVGTALSDRAGLNPLLPVKDTATWERIFRECAARYASNTSAASLSTP